MINTRKENWQQALIDCVTSPEELLKLLEINPLDLERYLHDMKKASADFALKVPHSFINRMKKGDLNDPLLLQVLPLSDELKNIQSYSSDPLQEAKFNTVPGLLHKYHGRVLLTLTGACGINCRYCFRRHFAYEDNNPGREGWSQAINYIKNDPTVTEVILSGGDPLIANDSTLANLVQQLESIPRLKRLRIHSRMPIVIPKRVTHDLLTAITSSTLQTIMVVHCNHPQEIDQSVKDAFSLFKNNQIALFNQTVLLKNINDNVEVLTELSEKLFSEGAIPYYLHVLDKVKGAAHFDISQSEANHLIKELRERLPGYLVPRLVREEPGKKSKTLL